jgi:hypothetical protein
MWMMVIINRSCKDLIQTEYMKIKWMIWYRVQNKINIKSL